jgi:hypothetical protein
LVEGGQSSRDFRGLWSSRLLLGGGLGGSGLQKMIYINLHPCVPDPHVFGPPGSGSISPVWLRILKSSFYHQAKKMKNSKKNLDSWCFDFFWAFYLKK